MLQDFNTEMMKSGGFYPQSLQKYLPTIMNGNKGYGELGMDSNNNFIQLKQGHVFDNLN